MKVFRYQLFNITDKTFLLIYSQDNTTCQTIPHSSLASENVLQKSRNSIHGVSWRSLMSLIKHYGTNTSFTKIFCRYVYIAAQQYWSPVSPLRFRKQNPKSSCNNNIVIDRFGPLETFKGLTHIGRKNVFQTFGCFEIYLINRAFCTFSVYILFLRG